MKNRELQPVERGKVDTRKPQIPQDTTIKLNRLENTELLIRRAAGSNEDSAKVSRAVINCGPGRASCIQLSEKHPCFALLPLLQVPDFSMDTQHRVTAAAEAALGSSALLIPPLTPEL